MRYHLYAAEDKMFTRIFSFFAIIIIAAAAIPFGADAITKAAPVAAATPAPAPYKYTRIFYYQESALAEQSLFDHPDSIDVLAPQSYAFDNTGTLVGSINATVLAFAEKHNIKVMPLVTNGSFTQAAYQELLDNEGMQNEAISALIAEAKKYGYWGWQFDFEQMDLSYRDKYSAFVAKAAAAMKTNGLILSVAVIAQISDKPADYPKNLWQKTIGAYDYAALGASADFVSIMSYDDPNSKGPIVEYPWLKKVLAYSLKLIPHGKLSLGIPFYYWQWNDETGKLVGIGGRKGIYNVLAVHKVTTHYSTVQQAPYLEYWSHAKKYTIWYENAESVAKKVSFIKTYQLGGFSAWALGLELPSIYGALD
jgi:spore germination protein YaaH